jgi:hypothetical protein
MSPHETFLSSIKIVFVVFLLGILVEKNEAITDENNTIAMGALRDALTLPLSFNWHDVGDPCGGSDPANGKCRIVFQLEIIHWFGFAFLSFVWTNCYCQLSHAYAHI